MKLQHHAARSIIWSEGFTGLAKALPYSWPEQEERTVGSPGYYFAVCENPRHSRGLRWRTPVTDRRLLAFRSSRGEFRALVSGAIFQFPFRRGGDRFAECPSVVGPTPARGPQPRKTIYTICNG